MSAPRKKASADGEHDEQLRAPGGIDVQLCPNSDPELIRQLLWTARRAFAGELEPVTGRTGHAKYRPPGLSQAAVARRLGIGTNVVHDWENGRRRVPRSRLDEVAGAYAMTPPQRDELWLIVTGHYPPDGPFQPKPEAVTGSTLYVRGLQAPAFVATTAWNIVESNRHWRDLFEPAGQPVPGNLLRFLLTDPYARQLCEDWMSGWAVPFLRELRLDAQISLDPELHAVVQELQENRALAPLWQAAGESVRTGLHNDTQIRLLRAPCSGHHQRVRLLVFSPAHDPGRRVVTVLPTPEPLTAIPLELAETLAA